MKRNYPPIRLKLDETSYNALRFGLSHNALLYEGSFATDANAIMQMIDRYARIKTEDGTEYVYLNFYEKEGGLFIWQFAALAYGLSEILSDESTDYFAELKSLRQEVDNPS
ncbi:hypothetical protein RFF05_16110 [Bengtsoniella intestinalis]|uniref:hypothetical protein n=1 Tax=Bengtsoniella intestinalis TaxID=3073143 RepID=UPI00391F7200